MLCQLIFYLNNWGTSNIIYRAKGSNVVAPNIGETIILNYNREPQYFIVVERILDYADNSVHLKIEKVYSDIDLNLGC